MIKRSLKGVFAVLKYYKLPILSGIFIGTSHVPFPPWATLFCFVPLWIFWIQEKSLKKIIFAGWWTQFVLTLIGFSWVFQTLRKFGGLSVVSAFIGFLIFCSLFHLYIPLAGLIWGWLRKKTKAFNFKEFWLLLPAFLALGELMVPTLFPWNHTYSWLWVGFPIVQLGDSLGFQGLSVLFVFYNLCFLFVWKNWKEKLTKKPRFHSILCLLLTIISFAYLNDLGRSRRLSLKAPDSSAKVLIVQANLGGDLREKYGWNYRSHVFREHRELTRKALQHYSNLSIDFVVWPEMAMQDLLSSLSQKDERGWRIKNYRKKEDDFKKGNFLQRLLIRDSKNEVKFKEKKGSLFSYAENKRVKSFRQFLKKNKIAIITGAYGKSSLTSPLANGFFLIGRNGENTDTPYFKTQLLAFGEYLPGAQWFPILKKWLPQVGDFLRGNGPEVKKLGNFKIGPQICYESLFPFFSLKLAQEGAQILVNITNDSWYDAIQEPYQHLYLAAARAIEIRRPLVRATNTGISTVVFSDGTFGPKSVRNEKWWALYDVPFYKNPKPTFYQKFPYLIHFVVFFYLSILFLFFAFRVYRDPMYLRAGPKSEAEKDKKDKEIEKDLGEEKEVHKNKKKDQEIRQVDPKEKVETQKKAEDTQKEKTEIQEAKVENQKGKKETQGEEAETQREEAETQGEEAEAQGGKEDTQGKRAEIQGEKESTRKGKEDTQDTKAEPQTSKEESKGESKEEGKEKEES